MAKTTRQAVYLDRRLLGNPYAHIEYLEEFGSQSESHSGEIATDSSIRSSRKLLEDPYAYLDGDGGFGSECFSYSKGSLPATVASKPFSPNESRRDSAANVHYSDDEIEAKAKELQRQLWNERDVIWLGQARRDPVGILDPAIALNRLGYEYVLEESLGQHRIGGALVEVAGLIDRSSRTVHVSRQFHPSVRTFTAAHELGHAVLHPSAGGVHRDRPADGTVIARERTEREADKFATYFLLPERLLRRRFAELFGPGRFELNEETRFALFGSALSESDDSIQSRRELSRILASAERYNGQHFTSLATQFNVSIAAMAIRLEELGLLF